MSSIPFEHFLLSTGLNVRLAGSYDGEKCNINAILMKNGKSAEFREDRILKSVVAFARSECNQLPSVDTALDELVKLISEKIIWFGDESLKVPKLNSNFTKVLRN